MKLIFSGKVLKDDVTLEKCKIKENDFLVVMVTKSKKAPAPTSVSTAPGNTDSAGRATASPPAATAVAAAIPAASAPAPIASVPASEFPAEVVSSLTGMGFPEDMVLACLKAAHGNPDVAVEFLTNGIPDNVAQVTSSSSLGAVSSSTPSSSIDNLAALRSHPQLNQLRRLVQTNPQALQAVLTQIGQQQPELLQAINTNQAAFLELMNEPIDESSSGATTSTAPTSADVGAPSTGAGIGGMMPNPGDMARMLSGLSEVEINEMATMMGLTSQQLRATAQAIGSMPPDQFQQHMMQAMGGGGNAGMDAPPGQQVIRLTDEEMASVNRLTEMGFDRNEAVQAFLACDKNEALAANLLMDSMSDGGFGGAGGFGGGGTSGGDDDMYD